MWKRALYVFAIAQISRMGRYSRIRIRICPGSDLYCLELMVIPIVNNEDVLVPPIQVYYLMAFGLVVSVLSTSCFEVDLYLEA